MQLVKIQGGKDKLNVEDAQLEERKQGILTERVPCDKWDHGSKESEDIVEVVLATHKAGSWLFLRLGFSWFYYDILFVAVFFFNLQEFQNTY